MITIGYGDIKPANTIERVFVMVISLIACGVFAYAVVSSLLTQSSLRGQKDTSKFAWENAPHPKKKKSSKNPIILYLAELYRNGDRRHVEEGP